jgi:hypothetical protein
MCSMRTRCTSTVSPGGQCRLEAHYVILYGCIEGHIKERPLCDLHSEEWLKIFDARKWACTCHEKIIEIRMCLAEEVTVEWLNI